MASVGLPATHLLASSERGGGIEAEAEAESGSGHEEGSRVEVGAGDGCAMAADALSEGQGGAAAVLGASRPRRRRQAVRRSAPSPARRLRAELPAEGRGEGKAGEVQRRQYRTAALDGLRRAARLLPTDRKPTALAPLGDLLLELGLVDEAEASFGDGVVLSAAAAPSPPGALPPGVATS